LTATPISGNIGNPYLFKIYVDTIFLVCFALLSFNNNNKQSIRGIMKRELEQNEWELVLHLVEAHWDTKENAANPEEGTEDDKFLGQLVQTLQHNARN